MLILSRGQRLQIAEITHKTTLEFSLKLEFATPRVCDFSCFGVDADNRLSDDRYFIFYNQKQSPEGAIRAIDQAGLPRLVVDLDRLPASINKLVLVATLDHGRMADLTRLQLIVGDGSHERAFFTLTGRDFAGETALLVAEVYRRDPWRLHAMGQGFDGGLSAVLAHFGGEEIAEPPPLADAARGLGNSGYKFKQPDPNAKPFTPGLNIGTLPQTVDLRPFLSPVEDQLQVGSCTANAVAGAYEYLFKRQMAQGQHFDVSRLFLYYNARMRDGIEHEDGGSAIQSAMESARRFGVCSENTWPYQQQLVLTRPHSQAYQEAQELVVGDMEHLPLQLPVWKQCLAEGYPIVFGCSLFESFDHCNHQGGAVRMPASSEVSRGEHGLHAMLCVGYSDVEEAFIVRNSWGEDWGDRGYCYMPYNYLMNPALNGGDNWIMRSTKAIPAPQTAWKNDARPVSNGGNGVGFNINEAAPAVLIGMIGHFFNPLAALPFLANLPSAFAATSIAAVTGDWASIDALPQFGNAVDLSSLLSDSGDLGGIGDAGLGDVDFSSLFDF